MCFERSLDLKFHDLNRVNICIKMFLKENVMLDFLYFQYR